jgi:exodeoxyribonuclease V alpha subunit
MVFNKKPYKKPIPAAKAETDKITGKISRLLYTSETFSAGKLIPDGAGNSGAISFSIKGMVKEQEYLTLTGFWVDDPKYGRQFTATQIVLETNISREGLRNYLANDKAFKGIGAVKAKIIADQFGDDFDTAIREYPDKIAVAAGLSIDQILAIKESWIVRAEENNLAIWLASFDLTPNQIKKIWDKYGNSAKFVLQENPYLLCRQIDGFGFARTDGIALKMGVAKDHPGRIQACLLDMVRNMADDGGHCWIDETELIRQSIAILALDSFSAAQIITDELGGLISNDEIIAIDSQMTTSIRVADKSIFEKEYYLGALFQKIAHAKVERDNIADIDSYVKEKFPSIKDAQAEALKNGITHRISLMTGEAGTGKTFTVNAIRETFLNMGLSVAMAAPTGKAAKRMEQMTGGQASTIHRLLQYCPGEGFNYNEDNNLLYDVIIIDEFSMVDITLAWHFFKAINWNKSQVILVGDAQQLPPVGAGNILRDLLTNDFIPVTRLTQVVRQAGLLKENSTAILHGNIAPTAPGEPGVLRPWYIIDGQEEAGSLIGTLETLIESRLIPMGVDPIKDLQVLTPYNKGALGVLEMNKRLQALIQRLVYNTCIPDSDKVTFFKGDKVMQLRNNYKLGQSGIMNGTVGLIDEIGMHEFIDDEGDSEYAPGICIDFDGELVWIKANGDNKKDVTLAYAATVHKMQGSECPVIISVIHSTHSYMLHRNLLYTAVTRARVSAILLGNRLGMRRAAANTVVNDRRTWLSIFDDCVFPEAVKAAIINKKLEDINV